MDWQLAITRNREALLDIVVALMAAVGLVAGGTLTTLPHFLYRQTLLVLRQAESALRRLIVIAAHGLPPTEEKPRKSRATQTNSARITTPAATRLPTFNLIDPLKTFGQETPNYSDFHQSSADSVSAANQAPVPAASLALRLLALKLALDSIPKHAKRLAHWYQQRDLALPQNQPHRLSPIRPGLPPAARQRKRTEMDAVLSECHLLALHARDWRDSS